jgi:hypothetical protein
VRPHTELASASAVTVAPAGTARRVASRAPARLATPARRRRCVRQGKLPAVRLAHPVIVNAIGSLYRWAQDREMTSTTQDLLDRFHLERAQKKASRDDARVSFPQTSTRLRSTPGQTAPDAWR